MFGNVPERKTLHMRHIVTLLITATTIGTSHAQCSELPILSNATLIDASGTVDPPPGAVWICGGLDVTILGSFHNLYIEPNCTVQVIGSFNDGFMKGPGTLTTDCDTCFWQFDPSVQFVPIGGDLNMGFPCEPVTFNYADAPANGCTSGVGMLEHTASAVQVELSPNPATDRVSIRWAGATVLRSDVVDLSGRTVLVFPAQNNGVYDVSSLPEGRYLARIQSDQGIRVATFNKL